MKCKYDRDRGEYVADGERCRVDEDGQPTKHCGARLTCSNHVAPYELTCSRCIGRTRQDVRQIVTLSTLMLPAAITDGVNSDAAHLAGPAANPEQVQAVRFYVNGHATHLFREGRISEETFDKILNALPDEDTWHPYSVLTRWQMMLSEDYGHPLPPRLTISGAAAYLERNLHVIAQDPEQDFPLLAREMRQVRNRIESVIHNSSRSERGAPCPLCAEAGHVVRLVREYGHWCTDEDCERINYSDDSGDEWYCPRKRAEHRWTHASYENYVMERQAAG